MTKIHLTLTEDQIRELINALEDRIENLYQGTPVPTNDIKFASRLQTKLAKAKTSTT